MHDHATSDSLRVSFEQARHVASGSLFDHRPCKDAHALDVHTMRRFTFESISRTGLCTNLVRFQVKTFNGLSDKPKLIKSDRQSCTNDRTLNMLNTLNRVF